MSISRGPDDSEDAVAERGLPGGPPKFGDVPFDPHDEDQVKVHYDVSGWSYEHRAELAEVLAEMEVPHRWDGDELVVPEELEVPMDMVFDALEQELGPFPVPLADGTTEIVYDLDEWPAKDVTEIGRRLVAAQTAHRWDDRVLIVGADDESSVDTLLDEVEAAAAAAQGPPPVSIDVVDEMFRVGRQLAKNPLHTGARKTLFEIIESIDGHGPPDGLEPSDWQPLVTTATTLRSEFDADTPDVERIEEHAGALAELAHQWV